MSKIFFLIFLHLLPKDNDSTVDYIQKTGKVCSGVIKCTPIKGRRNEMMHMVRTSFQILNNSTEDASVVRLHIFRRELWQASHV